MNQLETTSNKFNCYAYISTHNSNMLPTIVFIRLKAPLGP